MAEPKVTVRINVDDMIRQLRGIREVAETAISKGLNDSAFGLRKFWIKDMEVFLDNPITFTKKVFVKKANPNNLTSITFIPPRQSEYLDKAVEGGVRKSGDYATLRDSVLIPVKAKLNKSGNLPFGPKRWLGKIGEGGSTAALRNSFIGRPGGSSRGAVYQRLKRGGKLKLLAVFRTRVEYKKQLPLQKTSELFVGTADTLMQKQLDKLLS